MTADITPRTPPESAGPQGGSRGAQLIAHLRRELGTGALAAGDRLPTEAELCRAHGVSRAVVREAIAVLRSEGVVDVRRGVGAFVADPTGEGRPFADLSLDRMPGVIELLELRMACEVEAAGLAASRRSAAQLEAILEAHALVGACLDQGLSTRHTDFGLHFRIAEATQNRRFPELLRLLKPGIIAEAPASRAGEPPAPPRNRHLQQEHGRIVSAIIAGDAEEARAAMRAHLTGSLERGKARLIAGEAV
ncbi:FadR/GntR family transcriptional regulator [Mangrovicoccus algicola]|uniref:FadR family transcriptional regulator n=1 Tax=Mangrovicoccus algicola TaxID=2771008 RepID=A0A8J6ZAM3_9RHOB|nr:FCD domain-containing protein [Mangrovicoccus algicola]MBE3639236.1 FadR family transcriptional regulator [Mangrovicoccus algicola]